MANFVFDKYFIPIFILLMLGMLPTAEGQQTGACTGGTQYCVSDNYNRYEH